MQKPDSPVIAVAPQTVSVLSQGHEDAPQGLLASQPAQASTGTDVASESDATLVPTSEPQTGPKKSPTSPVDLEATMIYGDTQQDLGEEVRFSVELTRIDRLDDTYSMDVRRLKGNLRSYMFLYHAVRE